MVNDICSRLDALKHSSEDVDESRTVFTDTVHSSAMDSLGPVSRKHQDWFEENGKEIQGLLEEKHQKHKAYLSDTSSVSSKTAFSNICKTVQTRLRDMQDSWLSTKADEIQSFADRKDIKKFFDALKTVYGLQRSGTTPLLSADGTSLPTDKEAILKRWAEHFDGVLNRKRNAQVCDNHQGISLLSITGKSLDPWIDWMNTLNNQGFYQSQCGFRKDRINRHDLHREIASREMPGSKCGPLHDLCPLSTLSKHLTLSVVRNFGKLWQSLAVLPNS